MTEKLNTEIETTIKIYSIDEPQGDSGIFVNFLKYSTLFILIWSFAWVIILSRLGPQDSIFNWLADNPILTNFLLTIAIFTYFSFRIRKKVKYGDPFELVIDDNQKLLTVKVKNTFENEVVVKTIPFQDLVVHIDILENKRSKFRDFIETQRIIRILNNDKLETSINIQLTAWCRHPEIDNIVETLKSRAKNNWA